ncbi:MAG TPA: hypothetical protein EYM39_10740 [Candidatus Latescibacteria bacterium]|nr:hypothetical protein [Candidatus Latescibacterota bacterium]
MDYRRWSGLGWQIADVKKDIELLEALATRHKARRCRFDIEDDAEKNVPMGRLFYQMQAVTKNAHTTVELGILEGLAILHSRLGTIKHVIGALDKGTVDAFTLDAALARTLEQFANQTTFAGTDACVWTAASAIRLGGVSESEFRLNRDADLVQLNADKKDADRVKLCGLVRRKCERYRKRLADAAERSLVSEMVELRYGPGGVSDADKNALETFVRAECGHFGIPTWDR